MKLSRLTFASVMAALGLHRFGDANSPAFNTKDIHSRNRRPRGAHMAAVRAARKRRNVLKARGRA